MALRITGVNKRIEELWDAVLVARPGLKQARFAEEHHADGLRQQKFNSWVPPKKGQPPKQVKQPDIEGLIVLGRVFGVPWQWILLGDEGIESLVKFKEEGGIAAAKKRLATPVTREPSQIRRVPKSAG